jgi:hypothetical protein
MKPGTILLIVAIAAAIAGVTAMAHYPAPADNGPIQASVVGHPPSAPWDKAAFQAHPKRFLDVVDPGRAWLTAMPGTGPALEVDGAAESSVTPGGAVTVRIKAVPGSMATFTALGRGTFSNRSASISVATDARGLAAAAFTAAPGATGDAIVLSACPETTGQARFLIHIGSR